MHQVFWTLVDRLGSDGALDNQDQQTITDCFGKEYLDKLVAMIGGMSKSRVKSELKSRAQEATMAFRAFSKSETRKFLKSHDRIRQALTENNISLG
jgi:hypothetical protein